MVSSLLGGVENWWLKTGKAVSNHSLKWSKEFLSEGIEYFSRNKFLGRLKRRLTLSLLSDLIVRYFPVWLVDTM